MTALFGGLLASALMLSACGSGGGSADSAAGSGGEPVEGGVIRAAIAGDPTTLDMGLNTGSLTIVPGINIFENLFAMDEEFKPQPMLAESYEVSDDALTYTITLREGVTFHNGETMEADDVVASLERWSEISATGTAAAKDIESITAPDAGTVVIELKNPRYPLIADLAGAIQGAIIIPAEVAESAGDSPIPTEDIIGTGPFEVESYTTGQGITLTRFEEYSPSEAESSGMFGAKTAYVDGIEYSFVADPNQQLNGLKAGQYDWAQSISADQYETLQNDPQLDVFTVDSSLIATVLLNHNENSVFSSLEARRALNSAIDKKAMAQASFGPEDLWSPLNGSFALPENKPMHSDAGKEVYEDFDPEAAKAVFAEMDIDRPIRIYTTQTYPKYYQMAVVLQSALEEAGLEVDVQIYDFPTMISKLTEEPEGWDISMTAFSGAISAPAQALFLSPTWPGEYSNDVIDGLMADYNAAGSPDEAKKVVDSIQGEIWNDLPAISIAPNRTLGTKTKKLQDMGTFSSGIFWNAYLGE
jgi:peptide/nickel transport system substrate-binding protein